MGGHCRQIALMSFCVLVLILSGCGSVHLEDALDKVALDNGKFYHININFRQPFYEVILESVDYPTEDYCDDLAAKMFKKAYSREYRNMKFEYIEVVIGVEHTNPLYGTKHFERVAKYRLYRDAARNLDMEKMDNSTLAGLSNKWYRKKGTPEGYHDEYYCQHDFSVK
ncbi:hypothetical protein [Anaerovibrio sp. RM50]|uniref:hypothetical protein n=1 Tax=Anaerovibrio sp. RM50 TaxID=1200557 RepID=UPI000487BA43|nr:hypothetical protein [Anaerovibrio sp. RM50]